MTPTRELWVARAWGAAVAILPGLGAALTGAAGVAALGIGLLVEATAVALTLSQARAVQDGRHGDVMLASGARVPASIFHHAAWIGRAELTAGALGIVVLLIAATPWSIAHAILCAMLWALWFVARRSANKGWAVHQALQNQRHEEARRILEPRLGGRLGAQYEATYTIALDGLGRTDEAHRLREAQWTGALDASAVPLAIGRLQRGDPQLAQQLLPQLPTTNRYERWAAERLRGHLQLQAEAPTPIDPALLDDLPPATQIELRLLDAAIARRQGDSDRAKQRLDGIDLGTQAWRARAMPLLWAQLGGAPASTPHAPPMTPAPTSAFAAPRDDAPPPRSPRFGVGALPLQHTAIGTANRPGVNSLLGYLSVVLVGLLAVLFALTALLWSVGSDIPLAFFLAVGALGVLVTGLVVVRLWARRRLFGGVRGVSLSDGSILATDTPSLWFWWSVFPLLIGGILVPGLLLGAEWLTLGTVWLSLLGLPYLGIVVLSTRIRVRVLRLVHAIHTGNDDALRRAVASPPAVLAPWTTLGHLVLGDVEAASLTAREAKTPLAELQDLSRWMLAADGSVPLDTLLDLPRARETGPRFRQEVAVRLAALREDRPALVRDRIDDAWILPNRLGGGLAVLDHAILQRIDPAVAVQYATQHRTELREGDWIRRCWPHLFDRAPHAR